MIGKRIYTIMIIVMLLTSCIASPSNELSSGTISKVNFAAPSTSKELTVNQKLVAKTPYKDILPLSTEHLISIENGKFAQLGMSRAVVEKAFPRPQNVKEKYSFNFNSSHEYNYNGFHFTYDDNNNLIEAYIESSIIGTGKKRKIPITLGDQIKIGTKLKDVLKIMGKPTEVSMYGEESSNDEYDGFFYFLLRTNNGFHVMKKEEFKNLDKETAQSILVIEVGFDADIHFKGDVYHDTVSYFYIDSYMSGVEACYWDFGSWTFSDK